MGSGRSSGAGVVLCLTILGFIVSLFFFWPLAFAILFLGLAVFCALESSSKAPHPRVPQGRRPVRYEPPTQTQRRPQEYRRPYSPESYTKRETATTKYGIRIPVEEDETETEGIYRWEIEEEEREEPEEITGISEIEEDTRYRVTEAEQQLDELKEELEETRARYKPTIIPETKVEKIEEEIIVDEKAELLKDLESQEEATKIILEELKQRWMSGKIDLNMYQKLKEKYEKKIREIQEQKKKITK
ncbi:MAG: hypothetical protein ACUVXA_10520 [Candidatus Jordarchaeum sp.]|uniref:hypothetical protein n=1 Tax=Candidatus Jordarchaeum sp. TaxID=2823881 RepID=UPI00404A3425